MKRIISALITALIVSAILCACGNEMRSGSTTIKPSPSPTATAIIPSNIPESGSSTKPGALPSILPEIVPSASPEAGTAGTGTPDADVSASPSAAQ